MDTSSINNALSLVQKVIGLDKKATNLQYEEALLAAREALFAIGQENLKLKKENVRLSEALKLKEGLILDMGVLWKAGDEKKEQPYCPVCYSQGRQIPLQKRWPTRDKTQTEWKCPDKKCGGYFNPWDFEEGSSIAVGGRFNYPDAY